ncbi:MAG: two pore domain potassium channel family protein [Rivularia sp. (in: cyanobacteria)]
MSNILAIIGIVILIYTTFDVLVTTLTVGGGGPITSRISSGIWWLVLQIHHRKSNHRLLSTTGLVLLTGIALAWFILTWIGWALIFCAENSAVVNASSKIPADTWERIYFVGYNISTLGIGDYQAQGIVWQMATAISSVSGFFLVTLSIAYLLPIVSAASEKRAFATYISSLGGTADEILIRAWNGQDFGELSSHLSSLTPTLTDQGEKHLAYPVLHYFHSVERVRSLPLSLIALDEALTLLQYGIPEKYKPEPAVLSSTRRASAAFLKTLKSAYLEPASYNPQLPSLEMLRNKGIPTVSDEEFFENIKIITKRRRILLALAENDGWTWDAICSSLTTNRASSLDDETMIDDVMLH